MCLCLADKSCLRAGEMFGAVHIVGVLLWLLLLRCFGDVFGFSGLLFWGFVLVVVYL